MKCKVLMFVAVLIAVALPVFAQTQPPPAPVPAFSMKRVSLGLSAEFVGYRPQASLTGLSSAGEIKVGLPVAYNLGKFTSLTAKVRYGATSGVTEFSGGIVLHLLARGAKP
jgi:hypothetical protein